MKILNRKLLNSQKMVRSPMFRVFFCFLILISVSLYSTPHDVIRAEDSFREAYHELKDYADEDFGYEMEFRDIFMCFEFVDMAFSINCAHPSMIDLLMWKYPESSCGPICNGNGAHTHHVCLSLRECRNSLLDYYSYRNQRFKDDATDILDFEYSDVSTVVLKDRLKMLHDKIYNDFVQLYHFVVSEKILSYEDTYSFEVIVGESIRREMFFREIFLTLEHMINIRLSPSANYDAFVDSIRMLDNLSTQANNSYVLQQAIKLRRP